VQLFKIFVSKRSVLATGLSVDLRIRKVVHPSPVSWQQHMMSV